jgi:nucleotide-binding universal stress UspA family protein
VPRNDQEDTTVHVLVATDGGLDPEQAAEFATRLAGDGGRVTVLTVVEIPRRLLREMRQVWGEQPDVGTIADTQYVDTPAVPLAAPPGWPGDDAILERYLGDKRVQCVEPIVEAVTLRGAEAEGIVLEGEKPAALIAEKLDEIGADVLVVGSHGQGLFQGLLGSESTKLVRRSSKPILVIRSA